MGYELKAYVDRVAHRCSTQWDIMPLHQMMTFSMELQALGPTGARESGIMRLTRPCTGAWFRYRGPRPYPHVLQILDDLQARSSLLNTQWEFTRGLVCGAGSPSCVIGRLECTTRMCHIWALDRMLARLPADPRAHTYVDSPDSMAQTLAAKPMRLHM